MILRSVKYSFTDSKKTLDVLVDDKGHVNVLGLRLELHVDVVKQHKSKKKKKKKKKIDFKTILKNRSRGL